MIAFGVGEGGGTPTAALGTRGAVTWQQVAMRGTFFLGVLAAVGRGVLRARRAAVARRRRTAVMRRHALLLGGAFLVAFVGADALIRATAGSATRFERWLDVAAVASRRRRARGRRAALRWARALWRRVGGGRRAVRLPHARPATRSTATSRGCSRRSATCCTSAPPRSGSAGSRRSLLVVPARARSARARRPRAASRRFAIPMVLVLVARRRLARADAARRR